MVSRRIAEEVGVSDLTCHLAQFKVKSEPVKLGGLTKQFGVSLTRASDHSANHRVNRRVRLTSPNRRELDDMVRTSLTEPHQKKSKGITISEGGSRPSQKRKQDLPPGDKGKRKKHIAKKGAAIEPDFSEPEDEELLIHRNSRHQARSQPTPTGASSAAIPPTTKSVPAQAPQSPPYSL
uniref:Uncharacterized protein n=1 Tax=Solanum tuberosum TaxID=4113 RepID=M1DQD7_SOLTU